MAIHSARFRSSAERNADVVFDRIASFVRR
jgi:hypothetical protein